MFDDGDFAELVIWQVPHPVPPSRHDIKYRLAYVVDGKRVIGFDNERGKGDHRHLDSREEPYNFEGVERLIADFKTAVHHWRAQHDKN